MYRFALGGLPSPALFGRARQEKGWDHSGRVLTAHLWVYLLAGSATFCIGDRVIDAARGDSLFIPAGTFYRPKTQERVEYYFFHLAPCGEACCEESDGIAYPVMPDVCFTVAPHPRPTSLSLPYHRVAGAHSQEIEEALLRCERLIGERGASSHLLLSLEAYRVLALTACGAPPALPRSLQLMCAHIAAHTEEGLTLSFLSAHFGYSPSYVARLFRRHLDTTVSAYVNDLRLGRAYRLLMDTDLRVGEIAESCGFGDIYYFSRLVRRQYGKSPLALRRERGV